MPTDETSLRNLLLTLAAMPRPAAAARALGQALELPQPATVWLHRLVDAHLQLHAHAGLTPLQARALASIPLTAPVPEARCASAAEPLLQGPDELAASDLLQGTHDPAAGSLTSLPLLHGGRPIGVLSWRGEPALPASARPRRWDAVAAACALWLALDRESADPVPHPPRLVLTARQRRVLDGVAKGMTNAAIAADLGFAVGTIKADITSMSALVGARGRQDLLQRVERAGLR